jgi:hypothetical protein
MAKNNNFDHGGGDEDGFEAVEKPSKRSEKDIPSSVGSTEHPGSNIWIEAPHHPTFSPVKQARAVMTQLWLAAETMVIAPLSEEPVVVSFDDSRGLWVAHFLKCCSGGTMGISAVAELALALAGDSRLAQLQQLQHRLPKLILSEALR